MVTAEFFTISLPPSQSRPHDKILENISSNLFDLDYGISHHFLRG